MVDPAAIEMVIAGHKDTDLVGVPVSMLREIVRDYRSRSASVAQLAAASAIGDIGGMLAR